MQTCNNNHVIKSKGCNYCNSLSTNQPPKNCISHKCKYFLISEQQITGGSTAIIFIDNPKNNCKTISINKKVSYAWLNNHPNLVLTNWVENMGVDF